MCFFFFTKTRRMVKNQKRSRFFALLHLVNIGFNIYGLIYITLNCPLILSFLIVSLFINCFSLSLYIVDEYYWLCCFLCLLNRRLTTCVSFVLVLFPIGSIGLSVLTLKTQYNEECFAFSNKSDGIRYDQYILLSSIWVLFVSIIWWIDGIIMSFKLRDECGRFTSQFETDLNISFRAMTQERNLYNFEKSFHNYLKIRKKLIMKEFKKANNGNSNFDRVVWDVINEILYGMEIDGSPKAELSDRIALNYRENHGLMSMHYKKVDLDLSYRNVAERIVLWDSKV